MAEHDDNNNNNNDSMNYFTPTTLVVACRLLSSGGFAYGLNASASIGQLYSVAMRLQRSRKFAFGEFFWRMIERPNRCKRVGTFCSSATPTKWQRADFQTSLKLGV